MIQNGDHDFNKHESALTENPSIHAFLSLRFSYPNGF